MHLKQATGLRCLHRLFFTLTGSIVQPLLHHRELKTNYEVSEVQKEAAVITFRQSVLNAGGEVVNAMVQLDKLKTRAGNFVLHRLIHCTKQSGNATLLFRSGLADYLEVITAQSRSLAAELTLADIKRQRLSCCCGIISFVGWRLELIILNKLG